MKILFFFHNDWVFGKIHNELVKALYPDIYCDILDWTRGYIQQDMDSFINKYDYIMTTPDAALTLLNHYKVPHDKIVVIAHQDWDIFRALDMGLKIEDFIKFKGYCVICPKLVTVSLAYKIPRIPKILKIGLFTNNYPKNKNDSVNNIGYFAKFSRIDSGFDVKRGELVKEVAIKYGVPFVHNEGLSFLGIENAYSNISLMMFASLIEGNPYAALEAFACGIPVIGTDSGIFPDIARSGGGKIVSFEKDLFIEESLDFINKMNNDKCLYREMSDASQEESKKFDWSVLRETWINYFNSL